MYNDLKELNFNSAKGEDTVKLPKVGKIYEHYEGRKVKVLAIAHNLDTQQIKPERNQHLYQHVIIHCAVEDESKVFSISAYHWDMDVRINEFFTRARYIEVKSKF